LSEPIEHRLRRWSLTSLDDAEALAYKHLLWKANSDSSENI
jgi:hypothetical protein